MKFARLLIKRAGYSARTVQQAPVVAVTHPYWRSLGTAFHAPEEIEKELKAGHEKAAHALDGSKGDWDMPKSPQEMKNLNDLYHKLDALETELKMVKNMMREHQKTFAVDAPDGESDYHLKEELEEVNRIIDDASKIEDRKKIEKQHEMQSEVKKFHARDPEHDW